MNTITANYAKNLTDLALTTKKGQAKAVERQAPPLRPAIRINLTVDRAQGPTPIRYPDACT